MRAWRVGAIGWFVAAAVVANAQTPEGGGIVYGGELGVGVSALSGWVFDSTSGVEQGLHAEMYPVGSTWSNASEVMYVNIAKLAEGETLDDLVAEDVASFRKQSAGLVVKEGDPIELAGKKTAQIRYFSGDMHGNLEAIAYVEQERSVGLIVLSCRTKAGFDRSLAAFRQVVSKGFLAKMEFKP